MLHLGLKPWLLSWALALFSPVYQLCLSAAQLIVILNFPCPEGSLDFSSECAPHPIWPISLTDTSMLPVSQTPRLGTLPDSSPLLRTSHQPANSMGSFTTCPKPSYFSSPHFSHPDLSCFHFLHPTLYLVILCLQEVDRVSFFSPQNPFYFRMILDLEKLQRLYRDFPYILCPTSLMFTSYTMTAHLSKRRN